MTTPELNELLYICNIPINYRSDGETYRSSVFTNPYTNKDYFICVFSYYSCYGNYWFVAEPRHSSAVVLKPLTPMSSSLTDTYDALIQYLTSP